MATKKLTSGEGLEALSDPVHGTCWPATRLQIAVSPGAGRGADVWLPSTSSSIRTNGGRTGNIGGELAILVESPQGYRAGYCHTLYCRSLCYAAMHFSYFVHEPMLQCKCDATYGCRMGIPVVLSVACSDSAYAPCMCANAAYHLFSTICRRW